MLIPPLLKKGDTLGIIAPAGMINDLHRFQEGVRILKEMGFRVKFPRDLWPGEGYLADSDQNRGQECNELFRDKNVQGIISLRGGYGSLRMLDQLDLSLIKNNPKLLIGFSDISILLNYLTDRLGLVSLHGPVVTSLLESTESAQRRLCSFLLHGIPEELEVKNAAVLKKGLDMQGDGVLIGGNLASLVTLIGTQYDLDWRGKVLFIEDTNEPTYKIDRMLTQLKLSGKLDNIAGLILGNFSLDNQVTNNERANYRDAIWQRILEIFSDQNIPIWGDFPAGHCKQNFCFPIGLRVKMISNSKEIKVFSEK